MMMTLHYLKHSRAHRILWFLEELSVPYDLIIYHRDAKTKRAPVDLQKIHPLGKSPILVNGGDILVESGAIVDYLGSYYGASAFIPSEGTAHTKQYRELIHYAEGSAILPFILDLYCQKLGEASNPLLPDIRAEMTTHISYIDFILGDHEFFIDNRLTGVDIMMSFILEVAAAHGMLSNFANLQAYLNHIHDRPAYKEAMKKSGGYNLATMED